MEAYQRHDLTDSQWEKIQDHLPGSKGKVGRPARDNRQFMNAVMWIHRTGAPWRDLPPSYGHWKAVHTRFSRWWKRGVWLKLFKLFSQDADMEWIMIDASHCKVHPHAAGAKGGTKKWHELQVA